MKRVAAGALALPLPGGCAHTRIPRQSKGIGACSRADQSQRGVAGAGERRPGLTISPRAVAKSIALAVIVGCALSLSAQASEFDDCVLHHMSKVTSDEAALSIKEACLRNVEKPIPAHVLASGLAGATATFGQSPRYSGVYGLYITLNNNTGYTITELSLRVDSTETNVSTTYRIRDFSNASGRGEKDRTILEMIPPGTRYFFTPINETARDAMELQPHYSWSVVAAKGFRD